MPLSDLYRPETALLELGDGFYDAVSAADFPETRLRFRNDRAAETIGLSSLTDEEWVKYFGRFEPLPGTLPLPLAMRYHGHQFRAYNPDLGDGRGFSFAQMREIDSGRLLELGTKGSGQTPWSRAGDGRLTLKGGIREILATEMLEAQGVNTSRSLSLIETGERLYRGDEPSPTRSAVLVRLCHSHIRIGTFQRHAYFEDSARITELLDYCRHWFMPNFETPDEFLRLVIRNVARMGAQWLAAGFVHGVLNTDNINVLGESFDYGPWRWLPTLDPNFTAAYFDQTGLYCFGRQLEALHWNLQRLAECLLLVGDREKLISALQEFPEIVDQELRTAYLERLGLASSGEEKDDAFLREFNIFLHQSQVGYEQALFDWYGGMASADRAKNSPHAEIYESPVFDSVRELLTDYAATEPERLTRPYFQKATPSTLLIEEVEALWAPISEKDDWSLFEQKLAEIREKRRAYYE